jgi:hypothetical protein
MSGGPERSAGEIEGEVRGTRIAIARTLDALEHKLRARHLVQEGLAMVSETLTEPGDAGAGIAGILRANPVAFALIGAGLAYLLAGNTGLGERIAEDARVKGAVRQLSDLAGTIGDGAAAGRDAAGGWVHRAAGAMRETGSQVVERAGAVSGYAGDRAGRLAGDWGRRSALPVGAVAVVAGALLAAALPFSRFEAD